MITLHQFLYLPESRIALRLYLVADRKPILAAKLMLRLLLCQTYKKSSTWRRGHVSGLFARFPRFAKSLNFSLQKRFPISHYLASLILFTSVPTLAHTTIDFLPKGRLVRINGADPKEVRMAFLFGAQSKVNALIGNYISLFSVDSSEALLQKIHFGIEGAGFFGLAQSEGRFPLETTDGLVGLYLEGQKTSWFFQLRYTHISAHLSDGSTDIPIPYSREGAGFKVSFQPAGDWHLYSGFSYLIHTIPPLPPASFQVGGSFFLTLPQKSAGPFSSIDMKWKEEAGTNPSLSIQIGVAFNNPPEAYRSFRLFYNYFTGSDYRGQYYFSPFTNHSLGIEMQL